MSKFHRLERAQYTRLGEDRLPPGQAACVILAFSVLSWAVLISAVYAVLSGMPDEP
jgi:hypothetical protein